MIYSVTEPEILSLVSSTLKKLELSHIESKLSVLWNTRYTARLGCASYKTRVAGRWVDDYRVQFSVKLWERANQIEREEVVVHEVCHVAATVLYGRSGHGPNWKRLMIRCGYAKPQRCHNIDNSDLKRKRKDKSELMRCGCSMGVIVGPVVAKRIRTKRASYRCRICRQRITP